MYDVYKDVTVVLDDSTMNHDYYCKQLSHMIPISFGYIIFDTLFSAVPDVFNKKKFDLFLHHILAIGLVYYVSITPTR